MPDTPQSSRPPAERPATPGSARDPALGFAHEAMAALLRHRVSPTPENYLVWFRYHAGTHPLLRATLDERMTQGTLTQADLDEVHARFCAEEAEAAALSTVAAQLESTMTEVLGLLQGAGQQAEGFGERLQGFAGALAGPAAGLAEALQRILADTQELRRNSLSVAHRLAERTREASALRAALEEARRAASTDTLTGLPNRRAFDAALQQALAEPGAVSLVLLDVDHFKAVNDGHGHAAGDAVLRGLGATLADWALPSERAARTGGEEFAVLMPATLRAAAVERAESLRRAVAAEPFVGAEGGELRVTISLGVAERRTEDDAQALMERADAALYAAKRRGRDRVVDDEAVRAAA